MKTAVLFRDYSLEDDFLNKGYLILDLPDALAINRAETVYNDLVAGRLKKNEKSFFYSLMMDAESNLIINEALLDVFSQFYDKYFIEYEVLANSFLVKRASDLNELTLHQDWSFVDESLSFSATFWIPLSATDSFNGGLFLLPGSQKYFQNHRSNCFPTSRFSINPALKERILPIQTKRGQVIVFNPAIFHGSFPNQRSLDRVVATGIIKSKHTDTVYYFKERTETKKLKVSNNMLLHELPLLANGEKPSIVLDEVHCYYNHVDLTIEMLVDKINDN